jgi:soluble lytic murein transglycosylase
VRTALEQEDHERATSELRSIISKDPNFHSAECHYLLGILLENSGATNEAGRAFEVAAKVEWSLRRDAALRLARLALNQKNCARAETIASSLLGTTNEEPRVVELLARIDVCSGRWLKAAERLRWLVASSSKDRRKGLQLLLARAILEQARAGLTAVEPAAEEAAELVREAIQAAAPNSSVIDEAQRILGDLLSLPRDSAHDIEPSRERITLLEALVEARRWAEAKSLSKELLAQIAPSERETLPYCRVAFAAGRIALGTSNAQAAEESFHWVGQHCESEDLAARALFLWAGQLLAMSQHAEAIMAYAELERRFPAHRLADDARLKQALLHRAMGAQGRFVALLSSMHEAYPSGDMLPEALFQLALKYMGERNWAEALSVLERTSDIHKTLDRVRSVDLDRNQYFRARALVETGKRDAGVGQLRELILRRPLSYYMLLAYSALRRIQPELAAETLHVASESPKLELLDPDAQTRPGEREILERITTLLGVGDVSNAELELNEIGSKTIGQTAALAIAGTLANVGATSSALALAKRLGMDCRDRWPNAGWSEVWRQAYPRPYLELVRKEASRTALPESLVYAIMREESEFDPKAMSLAGAYGLMQLILPTARNAARELGIVATSRSLLKPQVNVALGTSVLARLMLRFERQIALVAAGYNAGPGRPVRWLREHPGIDTDLWIELIEYSETRNYVKRVLETNASYRWIYAENSESPSIEVLPERWNTSRGGNPD